MEEVMMEVLLVVMMWLVVVCLTVGGDPQPAVTRQEKGRRTDR